MRYDAFLSYSHRADRFRAVAVQRALHNIAKPFYRWKALEAFRDETSLAANPKLWPSIERALSQSRYFVLFANPESAASAWCAREIAWWLENRSAETLLIVVTGGELVYESARGDFDWSKTTALPRALEGRYAAEPFYRDLRWATQPEQVSLNEPRFRAEVLPLVAALHGVEPEALESDDLRQFRRARLFWRSATAGLAVLTLTSVAVAWLAERKTREAQRERAIAVARQVAAQAETARLTRASDQPRSLLLAVEAARRLIEQDAHSADVDRTLREHLGVLPRRPIVFPHAKVADFAVDWIAGRAVTASLDGWIGIWDLRTRSALGWLDIKHKASRVVFSPDLASAAFVVEKETIVIGVPEGQIIARIAHKDLVTKAVFDRQGKLLASASIDGTAIVIAMRDGREVARLDHGDPVDVLAFSADSTLLATGSGSAFRTARQKPRDDAAHVWDLASGQRRLRLAHPHVVTALEFTPDARILATGALDGYARSFDLQSGRELARIVHPDGVQVVRVSADGRYVASGSRPYLVATRDQQVEIWEAATGREVRRITHQDGIRGIAWSADGRWIATASTDRTVRLLGLASGEEMRLALDDYPSSIAFSPGGETLVVGGPDLRILLAESGFLPPRLAFSQNLTKVSISPVGATIAASAVNANAAEVWDFDAKAPRLLLEHESSVYEIAWSADARWVATAGPGKSVSVFDVASGIRTASLMHDGSVAKIAFSPDASRLASGSKDKTARLWDTASGRELRRFEHSHEVTALRMSGDGRLLATGTKSGEVHVRDVESGKSRMTRALEGEVRHLALSGDGLRVAAAASERSARVWDIGSGKPLGEPGDDAQISGMQYGPGDRLFVYSWNGVRLWDRDGKIMQADIRAEALGAIAFSHDGAYLATGGSDRTARVFRLRDMTEVVRLVHPVAVREVAFTADDRSLIVWSGDLLSAPHAVRLWPLSLSTLIDEACERMWRNLTWDEWRSHFSNEPYRRTCPERPTHASVFAPILERAKEAATAGHRKEARELYDALARATDDTDDASVANQICWFGAIDGAARQVLALCEHAVRLSPWAGWARDSRGLARALLGDRPGAIDDFTAYVAWAKRAQTNPAMIERRAAWIGALEQGRDPFDQSQLAALRRGEQ